MINRVSERERKRESFFKDRERHRVLDWCRALLHDTCNYVLMGFKLRSSVREMAIPTVMLKTFFSVIDDADKR